MSDEKKKPRPQPAPAPEESEEVPDGVAVFPHIPAELMVNPLLLAAVHSIVFLAGSDENIVQPDAADEALERIAEYLQRLESERLRAVKEDMACLIAFAKQEDWPRALIQSLKTLLADLGVDESAPDASEDEDEEDEGEE